MSIFSVPS